MSFSTSYNSLGVMRIVDPLVGSDAITSIAALLREMSLPISVDLRAFLIKLFGCHGLVVGYLRCVTHRFPGRVKDQQIRFRRYLEIPPGNRDVFFSDSEDPSPGDHQV